MATYLHLPEKSGIYQIINKVSEKRYVGYASNIRQRIKGHYSDLGLSKHPNNYLQKSWCKYGPNNFKFSVLQECSKNEMCLLEDYWVKILKTCNREFGYNLKDTDPDGKPGLAPETIEKMRLANKGKRPSDFCLQRRKEVQTSKEGKQRIWDSRKHIDYTKLHREKRGRKVIDNTTGKIYGSLAEVCELIGMTKGSLSRILLGKRKNKTNLQYL